MIHFTTRPYVITTWKTLDKNPYNFFIWNSSDHFEIVKVIKCQMLSVDNCANQYKIKIWMKENEISWNYSQPAPT